MFSETYEVEEQCSGMVLTRFQHCSHAEASVWGPFLQVVCWWL